MEEEWRDIEGYENLYQVSNKGQIKSLGNGQTNSKERILKISLNKNGRYQVTLSKNGKRERFYVHRLVAQTFLENPNNYPMINHKDENKLNNCVENLEFCTAKYNVNYGTAIERRSEKQKITQPKRKPIKCLDLQTNEISYYPSIAETARQMNILSTSIHDSIYKCKSPYKNRYIFTEQ